jgi:hypothetical protein
LLALLIHPCNRAVADEITSRSILASALTIANGIDDGRLKAQVLEMIAAAQAEMGDISGAKQTADAIVVTAADGSDIAEIQSNWKKEALAAIAGGQAGAGDIDGAFATVDSIDDAGTKAVAYQYIVQALARKGDITGAKASVAMTNGLCRTRANAAIAKAEATAGDITSAIDLAKSLNDATEQAQAFAFIAEAQAKCGDQTGAKQTVDLAKAAAAQVPDYLSRTVDGAVAKAEVKAGDADGTADYKKAYPSYVTREIATGLAETGDISGAKALVAQISDPQDQACTQANIALAELGAGDADGAVDALDSARRFALSIPDSSDNADGFGCVAQAWTKVGEPSAAADWIRSHQDPIVEVTGLIDIARAMRSGGQ